MDGLEDVLGDIAGEVLATSAISNDRKEKVGCFFLFLIIIAVIGGIIYFSSKKEASDELIKGVVLYKMSDNRLLVKTKDGENIYTVTQELYTNKNVKDSIILKKINK